MAQIGVNPIAGSRGVTLLELIITIAVLGILVSIAVPNFTSYLANQNVKAAAYDLTSSLNFARSEAVKRNANVTVVANEDGWDDGWAITINGKDFEECETAPTDTDCLRLFTPEGGLAITASGGATSVTYRSSGRLSGATDIALEVCDDEGSASVSKRALTVDLTGRPNLAIDGDCS